jgi:hypothetical protein
MTPVDEARFIVLWAQGLETAAIGKNSRVRRQVRKAEGRTA